MWLRNEVAVAQHTFPTTLGAFNESSKLVMRIGPRLIIEPHCPTLRAAGANVEALNDLFPSHLLIRFARAQVGCNRIEKDLVLFRNGAFP